MPEDSQLHHEAFVKLNPVFKDYLWGGAKLQSLYGVDLTPLGEAWLLSVHPDGESVIAQGEQRGMSFRQYLNSTGKPGDERPFPILVKLIDAAQALSVQVHPDDAYARVHEHDNGKNEMWFVLESESDAYLYVGFNRAVTRDEVIRRVENGTIEEILHPIPTHAGDVIYIPAGTVHAIGAGNLILEVQQSSNATYRLYDYQRRGADGNLRALHLDKALDVLRYGQYTPTPPAACKNFTAAWQPVHGSLTLAMDSNRFASVVCVRGEGSLQRDGQETTVRSGDSFYLPAGTAPAELRGELALVVTRAS